MMERYYFQTSDAEICFEEGYFQEVMTYENLKEIEVFEAIPDFSNPEYMWCGIYELTEVGYCGRQCDDYVPINGVKGKCKHKGSLFEHGEKVTLYLKQIK